MKVNEVKAFVTSEGFVSIRARYVLLNDFGLGLSTTVSSISRRA